ncbi:hypothetical protein FSC845_02515 [Francisella persica ATCC VR-331]|nr:hypothetical protein FSC845_02515 [Francisella persica ATCC VR-331]
MTPQAVLERCDENAIGVVLTLGVTFIGQYELVEDVCKALDDFEKQTDIDIPVHVDATIMRFPGSVYRFIFKVEF